MGFLSRSSMLPKGAYDDRGVSVMKRARRQRSESDKLLEEDLRRIRTTAPMTPGQRATAVAGIVLFLFVAYGGCSHPSVMPPHDAEPDRPQNRTREGDPVLTAR